MSGANATYLSFKIWQNSFEPVGRKLDSFQIKTAYQNGIPAGYCIFESSSGDITQIAVDEKFRRQGVASVLLAEVLKLSESSIVKLIYADNRYIETGLWGTSIGLKKIGEQYEMKLSI